MSQLIVPGLLEKCRDLFITILSLVVQGTQVSNMARKLGLALPTQEARKLKEFDVEFSDDIKSAMCEIRVKPQMLENGERLMDMSLPDHTLVAMVKRGNKYFIPRGNTTLKENDVLLIITDNEEAMQNTRKLLGT